jgi:hypothetical protein
MIKSTTSSEDLDAIKMLRDSLQIDLSINAIEIVEWVHEAFLVEDVYPEEELERWAKENGYVKEE